MTTHSIEPWFGFTEDKVFGEVMSNKKFCKYILETILGFKILDIHEPKLQEEINDPSHRDKKDVKLDVIVKDTDHNMIDLEMQTTNKEDLGLRLRYYAAKLDQRYTLKKGSTYKDLKGAIVIFLCTFDEPGQGRYKYTYHTYMDQDKSQKLNDNLEKIIINSKGKKGKIGPDFQALVDLMNDKPVKLNEHFDYAQTRIKELNEDPIWRDRIMDYETKLNEQRVAGEEKGRTEATSSDVKIMIGVLKKYHLSSDQIRAEITDSFKDRMSKAELDKLLKNI